MACGLHSASGNLMSGYCGVFTQRLRHLASLENVAIPHSGPTRPGPWACSWGTRTLRWASCSGYFLSPPGPAHSLAPHAWSSGHRRLEPLTNECQLGLSSQTAACSSGGNLRPQYLAALSKTSWKPQRGNNNPDPRGKTVTPSQGSTPAWLAHRPAGIHVWGRAWFRP